MGGRTGCWDEWADKVLEWVGGRGVGMGGRTGVGMGRQTGCWNGLPD